MSYTNYLAGENARVMAEGEDRHGDFGAALNLYNAAKLKYQQFLAESSANAYMMAEARRHLGKIYRRIGELEFILAKNTPHSPWPGSAGFSGGASSHWEKEEERKKKKEEKEQNARNERLRKTFGDAACKKKP